MPYVRRCSWMKESDYWCKLLTQSIATQPDKSRRYCVTCQYLWWEKKLTFNLNAEIFWGAFPQFLCADTPRSGALPSRVASKASAPVVSCKRTLDPARLPARAAENKTPQTRSIHSSVGWPITHCLLAPVAHMALFKTTIPEKSRHSSAGAFFRGWDIRAAGRKI